MEKALNRIIIWGIIGFIAQFIDGTLGMGYGVFSASIIIATGVMPAIASASVHTAEIFTTLVSGGSHLFFGNVKKEWLMVMTVPGVIGGAAGAYFLVSIPGDIIKPFVAAFLAILGLVILFRFIKYRAPSTRNHDGGAHSKVSSVVNRRKTKLPALGFFAAFMDAVGGGGWGPIATPGLILGENAEPRKAIGTVNLIEFFVTISISVTFFLTLGWESYDWPLVGALMCGGVIAAPLAAFLCKKLPIRILGISIGILLIATNLRTLILTIIN